MPADALAWPPPGFRHIFPAMPAPARPAAAEDPRRSPEARARLANRLSALARAMQAEDPFDPAGDNPAIPAGYTYLMQFVAHDIVRTALPVWAIGTAGRETRDLTVSRLRLDTLYGGGPAACPYAYDTAARSRLRIAPIAPGPGGAGPGSAPPRRDIPRARFDPPPPGWPAGKPPPLDEAMLPDPRNDDNSNVSQMTVLFAAFHNAVADTLTRAGLPADMRFAVAREAATLVYRRILREDLLRRLLHGAVFDHYAAAGRGDFLDTAGDGAMPLEFCLGAFRCGHAMVRESYRINDSSQRDLGGILRATSGGGAGAMPLSRDWTIRWSRFFAVPGPGLPQPNPSRRLRPEHSPGLLDTRFFGAVDGTSAVGLAYRDLLGAGLAGLRPVAALWAYLREARPALAALSGFAREAEREAALRAWLVRKGVPEDSAAALAADPPLPFYVLFEAAQDRGQDGTRLGVLGSVIVAETILGILARDPLPCEAEGGGDAAAALGCLAAACGLAPAVLAPLAGIADMPGLVARAAEAPGIGRNDPAFI